MAFELTPESLKKLCRQLGLYSSCPELNEVIHLHQKGIVQIKNLDKYTGLKTIYFECNAISCIEGLEHLAQLRCLYLNQNLVEHVSGLDSLKFLETLDLADNQIKTIKGLSGCTALRQLNLSGNRIRSKADVEHLLDCPSVISLDMAKNRIDEEDALKVLRSMPLNLLRLSGNPIVSKTFSYRKSTVACMNTLTYLDETPVFDNERRLALAWVEGGAEAEKLMRERIRKEEADLREYHHRAFQEMVERTRAEAAMRKVEEEQNELIRADEARKALMEQEAICDVMSDADKAEMCDCSLGDIELANVMSSNNKRDGSELSLEESTSPAKYTKVLQQSDCKEYNSNDNSSDNCNIICNSDKNRDEDNMEVDGDEVSGDGDDDDDDGGGGGGGGGDDDGGDDEALKDVMCEQRMVWAAKERDFKKTLQEKLLQRAAMEAESHMTKSDVAADKEEEKISCARPVIWGTKVYRELWTVAASIDNTTTLQTHQQQQHQPENEDEDEDEMNE